jgi:hypothetical protein
VSAFWQGRLASFQESRAFGDPAPRKRVGEHHPFHVDVHVALPSLVCKSAAADCLHTLPERIPAVNGHKGSVMGLETDIAVGKALSGIGFS